MKIVSLLGEELWNLTKLGDTLENSPQLSGDWQSLEKLWKGKYSSAKLGRSQWISEAYGVAKWSPVEHDVVHGLRCSPSFFLSFVFFRDRWNSLHHYLIDGGAWINELTNERTMLCIEPAFPAKKQHYKKVAFESKLLFII